MGEDDERWRLGLGLMSLFVFYGNLARERGRGKESQGPAMVGIRLAGVGLAGAAVDGNVVGV